MSVQEASPELWGGETTQGGRELPGLGRARAASPVVRWLGRIKGAAARVERRARPARRRPRASGSPPRPTRSRRAEHDDQFPIDVFQTGSGTSSNMNANEVIATLAGDGRAPQRPRQHGPVLQRRVPDRRPPRRARRGDATACCRRSSGSRPSLAAKAEEFADIVKAGRTHLMDAVPVTLGQEFGGYAAQIRLGARRVRRRAAAGRPDPARRHRDRHRAQHAPRVRRARARARSPPTPGSRSARPRTRSRRRATATRWSSSPAR